MKFSLLILAAAITSTNAFYSGFNVGANLASGACRSESDWEFAFNKIASFPGEFRNIRLYASSDCNTLANAVPAAIRTGTKLLVGVWTQDDAHFDAEKQALLQAVQQYGKDWILAISVGSEDLYREETTASILASKINDVRGMMWSVGASDKSIGHVDTWTAWVDDRNTAVIEAVDWLGNDLYPYWEGVSTDNGAANGAYWAAVEKVRAVSQGKDVWTTETGNPITGDTVGNSVPSIEAAQIYWWQVTCASVKEMNYFWYDLDDFAANPQFSVVDTNYNPLIDMTCA
ncbi:hypothetical protein PMZ80_008539 [Knufia obscura]|uniref:Probable glucan endo-1,3-beta-glucosidase eglC n=2 Tax=Knufia TaxID=430999 RepID=A0AAN8I4Q0_9EURO|nr:hypothetical protein PMZ80_008539 [Knufia obscura]KAK5951994.1 hypothetical protein OHC33_006880 [Knufia fluminis]